jgi:hypothetical protein
MDVWEDYITVDNGTHKNEKWLTSFQNKPNTIEDRSINKLDAIYSHVFRLIDFDNQGWDFKGRYIPPQKIYATVVNTPDNQYKVYEVPAEREVYTPLTIQDDFIPGQKVNVDNTSGYINTISLEDTIKVVLEKNGRLNTKSVPDSVVEVNLSFPVYPNYKEMIVHPPIQYVINYASGDWKNWNITPNWNYFS